MDHSVRQPSYIWQDEDQNRLSRGSIIPGQYEINMPRLRSWNIVDHVIAKEIFTILLLIKLKNVSFKSYSEKVTRTMLVMGVVKTVTRKYVINMTKITIGLS